MPALAENQLRDKLPGEEVMRAAMDALSAAVSPLLPFLILKGLLPFLIAMRLLGPQYISAGQPSIDAVAAGSTRTRRLAPAVSDTYPRLPFKYGKSVRPWNRTSQPTMS